MAEKLMEQLASLENLLAAWRAVRRNIPKYRRHRSVGSDGISLAEFERDLPAQLNTLQDMLLKERYEPTTPDYFTIPKRSGGQRGIGVLTVRDRVAQRAAQHIIEPIWEPLFLNCSYGYRPGISPLHAIAQVQELRARDLDWVVDGDIEDCFDRLDHDLLLSRLRRHIKDHRVLRLLQLWLDNGLMQAEPPSDRDYEPADRLKSTQNSIQRGVNWILDALILENDPYTAARYEYGYESEASDSLSAVFIDNDAREGMQQRALKRLAAGGILWGASWAGPAASILGEKARTKLSSPSGRSMLKKSAIVSGGLAGAAGVAALTTYLLRNKAGPAPAGVLQGSPLSPLLANIYLHPFDLYMSKRRHRLVRFADDWVALCPTLESAEAAYNDAICALARLRLKINRQKTHILTPDDTLNWLGVEIRALAGDEKRS